jgi:hypothetical protein
MYKLQLVILNAWNVTRVQEYEFHIFKVKIYNTFHYKYFSKYIIYDKGFNCGYHPSSLPEISMITEYFTG